MSISLIHSCHLSSTLNLTCVNLNIKSRRKEMLSKHCESCKVVLRTHHPHQWVTGKATKVYWALTKMLFRKWWGMYIEVLRKFQVKVMLVSLWARRKQQLRKWYHAYFLLDAAYISIEMVAESMEHTSRVPSLMRWVHKRLIFALLTVLFTLFHVIVILKHRLLLYFLFKDWCCEDNGWWSPN